jgi:hypothetical protein
MYKDVYLLMRNHHPLNGLTMVWDDGVFPQSKLTIAQIVYLNPMHEKNKLYTILDSLSHERALWRYLKVAHRGFSLLR